MHGGYLHSRIQGPRLIRQASRFCAAFIRQGDEDGVAFLIDVAGKAALQAGTLDDIELAGALSVVNPRGLPGGSENVGSGYFHVVLQNVGAGEMKSFDDMHVSVFRNTT